MVYGWDFQCETRQNRTPAGLLKVLQMPFLDSKSWQQDVGTCSGASGLLNTTVIYTHIMAEQPEDNRDWTVEKPALMCSVVCVCVCVQSY